MKLVPVEKIPYRMNNRLQDILDGFAESDDDIVKIDFEENEYKSVRVAASVIAVAIKRSRHNMKVSVRGDQVFLFKIKD